MPRKPPSGPGAPRLAGNVSELRALAHPLRLRMLELFAEAPRTTKQVADLLGQPPTRLYHHVAALERAGLLHLKETRKKRGTVEKWYESAARTMGSGAIKQTGSKRALALQASAQRGAARAVLEQSRQELLSALGQSADIAPMLARLIMIGPPKRAQDLRRRLRDFIKELHREYECDEAVVAAADYDRWALTITFAPTAP